MKVVVKPVLKSGPNGNRDVEQHPYYDYCIHVLPDDGKLCGLETMVHTVSGFDRWWIVIKNRDAVRSEALEYARRLARSIGNPGIAILKEPS